MIIYKGHWSKIAGQQPCYTVSSDLFLMYLESTFKRVLSVFIYFKFWVVKNFSGYGLLQNYAQCSFGSHSIRHITLVLQISKILHPRYVNDPLPQIHGQVSETLWSSEADEQTRASSLPLSASFLRMVEEVTSSARKRAADLWKSTSRVGC